MARTKNPHIAAVKSWETRRKNAGMRDVGIVDTSYMGGAHQMGGDWARPFRTEQTLHDTPITKIKAGSGISTGETYTLTLANGMKANFKPSEGEMSNLRAGIKHGQQAEREMAAWEIAKLVGMDDMVASVAIREVDVPGYRGRRPDAFGYAVDHTYPPGKKRGAMLLWQEGTPADEIATYDRMDPDMYGYLKAEDPRPQRYGGTRWADMDPEAASHKARADRDVARAALFDFIIGNSDRHAGNWIVDEDGDGRITLIDHGLAFGEKPISSMGGNALIRQFAEERERSGDLTVNVKKLAEPYMKARPQILKVMSNLKLPKSAIERVSKRIEEAYSKTKLSDLWD
jgi:hypothetical protein